MRITAAGTVPDSHRIPLHLSDVGRSIAIVPVRKNTLQMYNFFGIYCTIIRFFLILPQNCNTMAHTPQFLIAAPTSGSGKTTIARGLMALYVAKGYAVQPYKCGPDYIDTKFHAAVCGRPSINLDTFMATPDHVRQLFYRYAEGADIRIIEGMMGLYDGYERDEGSSAQVARVLDVPVVLVVDARSAAYSMAALIDGFIHFRRAPRFAGVIFNKVGGERHQSMLSQVCEDLQVECLGMLPKNDSLEHGSRYLGLDFSHQAAVAPLIKKKKKHVRWERLLQLS